MPINSFLYPGAKVTTGYEVANSLRFNSGSSDYLTRTPSSATNQDLWSLSFWIKRSNLGSYQSIYGVYANSTNQETLAFDDSDRLYWQLYQSSAVKGQLTTNRVFRDVSAFYNILIVYDSANGTAGNRMRMYINGVEETSFATDTNPSSGQDSQWNSTTAHTIGRINTTNYMNGYISELVAVDGSALDPTSFGEFDEDTGIWKPIDVSGLTFGTNGFYLDFENSGSLGADVSGNGNNFTVNNLTSIDQSTDTCTNNFATLNPLCRTNATLLNGNLEIDQNGGDGSFVASTFGASSGKYYVEVKLLNWSQSPSRHDVGIATIESTQGSPSASALPIPSNYSDSVYYNVYWDRIETSGGNTTLSSGRSNNDIFMMALDLDNNYFYFGRNGTWLNSGDPTSGSSGTGGFSTTANKTYFITTFSNDASSNTIHNNDWQFNFGNPVHSISSGNSDGNGHGNFEYAVPSGYYSLNTKNLAEYG